LQNLVFGTGSVYLPFLSRPVLTHLGRRRLLSLIISHPVPSSGVHGNAQWDVALRLLIVLSVAGFIGLAAGLYENRREKSTSATAERNFAEIQQRVQILSNQIHILTDQFTAQLIAKEVQLQALNGEVQALRHQCESRLKELEDALRVRRLEPGPGPR
jgi:uncharacterized protein HemX